MRSYGKRILRKKNRRDIENRKETRDAIVWDVFTGDQNRYCRVKIQGSGELIKAYYPFNWGNQPEFIKPGNAVKIMHTGGVRGRIEVIGHGQLVPTAVSGSGTPTSGTPPDAVITGGNLHELPNADDMRVSVDVGTYRINGVTYTLSDITMSGSSEVTMGDNSIMGGGATAIVTLDPAPSVGYFRYDLVSVGTDGIVDVTTGVESTTNPIEPTVEANHIKLGHVLIYGGMTVVTYPYINAYFSTPVLSSVSASITDEDLDWMSESTTEITISAFDQYGIPFSRAYIDGGLLFVIEFSSGNGGLNFDVSVSRSEHRTGASSHTFTYTRGNNSADVSPFFVCKVEDEVTLISAETIFVNLYDGLGDYMN